MLRQARFNAIVPYGDPSGVAAILAAVDLPAEANLLALAPHVAPFERVYCFPSGRRRMLRMAVDRATFRGTDHLPPVRRLGPVDLPALIDLYSSYRGSVFSPDQLQHGAFYGVRRGACLVAAAGTHVVAARYGIAAIGNVYTRSEVRQRGYGTAATVAVVAELLAGPIRDVILNVAADNDEARRVYERLGFRVHCEFWEAGVQRLGSAADPLPPSQG